MAQYKAHDVCCSHHLLLQRDACQGLTGNMLQLCRSEVKVEAACKGGSKLLDLGIDIELALKEEVGVLKQDFRTEKKKVEPDSRPKLP